MIYLKLILACVLSAIPFLYASYVKPRRKTSKVWRNMYTAIGAMMPHLKIVRQACVKFLHRLYDGMKRSDNFRKFFTLVVLLLMIGVQFVDYTASVDIAQLINDAAKGDGGSTLQATSQASQAITVYGSLMSKPHATLLAAAISLTLFAYSIADRLLTRLHNSQKLFFFIGGCTMLVLQAAPRFFIVAEMMEMLLLSAMVYPNKSGEQQGGKRKPVPVSHEEKQYKNAA